MKLTINQLLIAANSGSLARFASDRDFSMKVKYRLKGIWKQCVEHLERYNELRIDICKQYGELKPTEANPDVSEYVFPNDETKEKFNADLKDLQAMEIEIIGETFTLSDITKPIGKPDTFSAEDLYTLDWLIGEDEQTAWPEEAIIEEDNPLEMPKAEAANG